MYTMRWLYWSWFHVIRSTFDEVLRENDFTFSFSIDLDLWPLNLKFAALVTLV